MAIDTTTSVDVQSLTPFKKFIMTIGALPTSYLESMTYAELVMWFCDYLQNTVIPTVNNNAEAVEELQGLYEELKQYVNNYFDNLDVQAEIDKKLDEMVVGGQLQLLLAEQYDALRTEVNDEIDNFENNVDSQITAINNKVTDIASGKPIVVSSAGAMTDTTKIYLLTTDGKWYYYNGTNWTVGGTYQSTGIGEGEVEADNLEGTLATALNISLPELTWTSGYYRNLNGVAATNNNYSMSNNFLLEQGDTLYISCNGGAATSVSIISIVTPTGDPVTINNSGNNVPNYGNVEKVYKLKALFDCYVSLSIYNSNSYNFCFVEKGKDTNIVKDILNYRVPLVTWNYHAYANGNTITNHNLYMYSDPIQLYEGDTIQFHAKGEASAISLLRLVQSDGTYISTLIQTSGTREYDVTYKANTDCYVSICSLVNFYKDLIITNQQTSKEYNNELFSSFIKFGVIGDSLASGESVANNGGSNVYVDNYDYSWGQFIARNHGMSCINFSKGGATTRSWLNPANDWGLTKLLNPDNKCNAYIIGLGVNDPSIDNYLGTIDDIHLDDFTQNADSFYGNYARIIGYIKQVQPKAKIFMLTMPGDYGSYLTAIRDISGLYDEDVYLIDLNRYYYEEFSGGFINQNKREGHFNAIGYNYIGELLYSAFTNYMIQNYQDFKQIEFIGTNYSYTE